MIDTLKTLRVTEDPLDTTEREFRVTIERTGAAIAPWTCVLSLGKRYTKKEWQNAQAKLEAGDGGDMEAMKRTGFLLFAGRSGSKDGAMSAAVACMRRCWNGEYFDIDSEGTRL